MVRIMDEITSYKMCAVKVRNAKLRNYLKMDALIVAFLRSYLLFRIFKFFFLNFSFYLLNFYNYLFLSWENIFWELKKFSGTTPGKFPPPSLWVSLTAPAVTTIYDSIAVS